MILSQLPVTLEILGVNEALYILLLKYNSLNIVSLYLCPMRLQRQVS